MPQLRRPRKTRGRVRVVTECSGLEPVTYALHNLGLSGKYKMMAACEVDKHCRLVTRLCHQGNARPNNMFKDITRRLPRDLPDHDLYVAGFPCQPFSAMGANLGVNDPKGRGKIIHHIIAALEEKRPRAFLLENVKGLTSKKHKDTFESILQQLRSIGGGVYDVRWKLANTAHFGLPQHRERLYIMGLLRSSLVGKFDWPEERKCMPLHLALKWGPQDKDLARRREKAFLANAPPKLKLRLKTVYEKMRAKGINARSYQNPVVVDIDAAQPRWMQGISP